MKRRLTISNRVDSHSKRRRLNPKQNLCSMCLGDMPFPACVSGCGHKFHEGCLMGLAEGFQDGYPRCPVCLSIFIRIHCSFHAYDKVIYCLPGPRFSTKRIAKGGKFD